jgi:hypothetical protein
MIVETTRPRFEWPAESGAAYVVSVLDGTEIVAESPRLTQSSWQPAKNLPRGRSYQWQVEVFRGGGKRILPAPPAPPALFRVLDAKAHAELEAARAAHPRDALLLGVLYARHGLRAEAERELARVETEDGRRLLQSFEEWPR